MQFTCSIQPAVIEEDNGEVHAAYPIEVTVPLNNSLHGRAALFYTTKRFKSFEDLNRKLALLARKDLQMPKLPQKSWGRNMDSEFLEARREGLQHYLAHLQQLGAEVHYCEPLLSFLGLEALNQVLPGLSAELESKIQLYEDAMAVISQLKHANNSLTVSSEEQIMIITELKQ